MSAGLKLIGRTQKRLDVLQWPWNQPGDQTWGEPSEEERGLHLQTPGPDHLGCYHLHPHQAQREEISSQTAEREVAPLEPETTPTDRLENGPEIATTLHNQPRPSEDEGRPRREVRKPIRYQDYECYTLQPGQRCLLKGEIATRGRNCKKKELISEKKLGRKELNYLSQSKALNNHLDQSGPLSYLDQSEAPKHWQTTPSSWLCVQLNTGALTGNTYCKKILDINDYRLATMSKESY